MTIEEVQKLKKISEEQLVLNEDNVINKSLNFPLLHNQYIQIYFKEVKLLKTIKADLDKLYGELYHKFKFSNDFNIDGLKEIDIYIRADQSYYNKLLEFNQEETVVKYLEMIIDNVKNAGYAVKNYIDLYKFKNGL